MFGAKYMFPSPGKTVPAVVEDNVPRDDRSVGSVAALFKESMKCVFIIGTAIWFILLDTGCRQ